MEHLKFLFSSSFYPPYHIGGDATHVEYLSKELADRGHEVHIIHSLDAYKVKRGKIQPNKVVSRQENVFVHAIKSPLGTLDPLLIYTVGNSLWVDAKFSQILKDVRPNVVHHHNISLMGYDLLRKRSDYLSLYTAHDYWLICPTNNLFKNQEEICNVKSCSSCSLKSNRIPQIWRSCRNFKMAVRNIDLLISPSEYVRKRLVQEIDVPSVTLPNFVPHPPDNIPSSRYENYFLFLGMLEKHKGILNLIELFKEQRHNLNAKLVVAGGGSLSPYIRDYIEENSLSDSILFLGFVDNMTKYSLYANALAVIIPSIWPENAPLVALEALSVGTPVISSNQGGLPEIIEKVDPNLIFNDWTELKDILLHFSKKDLSPQKIKNVFEKNFSPKAYTENYLRIIRNLLNHAC
ncbi:MAG: glycosyltransferase [Candidatus Bathyarchaeia archaeon]